MEVNLKVSTAEMVNRANDMTQEISNLQKAWNGLGNIITKTKNYWQGDASNLHQQYYKENEKAMTDIIKRFGEHPKDLMEIAGLYDQLNTSLIEQAGGLPQNPLG